MLEDYGPSGARPIFEEPFAVCFEGVNSKENRALKYEDGSIDNLPRAGVVSLYR